jgi:hypothetical protein
VNAFSLSVLLSFFFFFSIDRSLSFLFVLASDEKNTEERGHDGTSLSSEREFPLEGKKRKTENTH